MYRAMYLRYQNIGEGEKEKKGRKLQYSGIKFPNTIPLKTKGEKYL